MSEQIFSAKPTLYNGRTYKSRLEANFARWLTEKSIKFDYSPRCFGSEQYEPDFVLTTTDSEYYRVTFIEIKPICFADEAWVAIRAAEEEVENLLVLDSPERDTFGCYAIVWNGKLTFFTSRKGLAIPFNCDPHPGVTYPRSFKDWR